MGLLALAGFGACGGNDTETPAGATVPQATSSTTPADQYAVPATIDAAYLDKVFAALDSVDNQATKIIVAQKNLPPNAAQRLASIYADAEFRVQTNRWLDVIEQGDSGFKPDPGGQTTTVVRVLSSSPTCIFAEVRRDTSANAIAPTAPHQYFMYLVPLDGVRNSGGFNPTPWMIAGEGFNSDGSVPASPCD